MFEYNMNSKGKDSGTNVIDQRTWALSLHAYATIYELASCEETPHFIT